MILMKQWDMFSYYIKIQIHLFTKITWFQHGLIHWHWYFATVKFYPCLILVTSGMEILIKAWSRCHKDHHKYDPVINLVQLGIIITQSNITWYCIQYYSDRNRPKSHKRHHRARRHRWTLPSQVSSTVSIVSVSKKLSMLGEDYHHSLPWTPALYICMSGAHYPAPVPENTCHPC